MVEFDGGEFHRSQPLTLEHVQTVLRRISGTDVTLNALLVGTTWTDRAYQATSYRRGRVLIAGDAAHLHSPLGGQGLNLGLGDAMNLGWKLAATVRGDASADLLDSYFDERHPVAAEVLNWSRAQVAIMRPNVSSRALEAIIRDLIYTKDGASYFAERIWAVSQRYDLRGEHPLVGRVVPDFQLTDITTVSAGLREGRGVLLDFDQQGSVLAAATKWGDRINYMAGRAKEQLGLGAVLVRPDGFVAWATDGTPDPQEIVHAATQWFGAPN